MKDQERTFPFGKPSISKVERYGWIFKDVQGVQKSLDKHAVQIHPAYQRHANPNKVRQIASAWSWIACGAIVVGKRNDELWAIDGQHRLLAARMRSDISVIPCLVFETESVSQEAQGFINLNLGRKAVSSYDQFRARLAADDEVAAYVDRTFKELGIIAKNDVSGPLEFKSLSLALAMAAQDRDAFRDTMQLVVALCYDRPIKEKMVQGLSFLRNTWGKFDTKFIERAVKVGHDKLHDGATRAAAFYKRGGAKVFAQGMLEEMNKGLRNRFSIDSPQSDTSRT